MPVVVVAGAGEAVGEVVGLAVPVFGTGPVVASQPTVAAQMAAATAAADIDFVMVSRPRSINASGRRIRVESTTTNVLNSPYALDAGLRPNRLAVAWRP